MYAKQPIEIHRGMLQKAPLNYAGITYQFQFISQSSFIVCSIPKQLTTYDSHMQCRIVTFYTPIWKFVIQPYNIIMFSTPEIPSASNWSTCTAKRNYQYQHLRKDRTYIFALLILVKHKQISFCKAMSFHKLSCKSHTKPSSVSHNHLAF